MIRYIFMLFILMPFFCGAAENSFNHPGIFVSLKQLQYVKDNLSREPWKSAYEKVLQDPLADKHYEPTPWSTVECGSSSNPNNGCTDEVRDAQAAYTQALLWRLSGETVYAENVGKILNAWANTLTGGHTNSNGPLQASWSAAMLTRAAEIVKYTYTGWPQSEKDKVTKLFSEQYYPDISRMFSGSYACYNKNWHASAIEAMLNIAVFNKNTKWFNDAIEKWHSLVPSYIYLSSDGSRPKNASWCSRNDPQINAYWNNPKSYVDGLTQESCRDFEHTAYGLAAIINTAETARLQGIDLYQDKSSNAQMRIIKAMELHSAYQTAALSDKLCQNYEGYKLNTKGTFEVGFNQYSVRQGLDLPHTADFLLSTRPTKGHFHYLWETLTHGLVGDRN